MRISIPYLVERFLCCSPLFFFLLGEADNQKWFSDWCWYLGFGFLSLLSLLGLLWTFFYLLCYFVFRIYLIIYISDLTLWYCIDFYDMTWSLLFIYHYYFVLLFYLGLFSLLLFREWHVSQIHLFICCIKTNWLNLHIFAD